MRAQILFTSSLCFSFNDLGRRLKKKVRSLTKTSEHQLQVCNGRILKLQMSAGGAFGGNRGSRPVPPEKGVFPLDHLHQCDAEKKEYLSCLKSSGHFSENCRQFSKKYLECRMAKNLMAKQNMSELGFREENDGEASREEERDRIEKSS